MPARFFLSLPDRRDEPVVRARPRAAAAEAEAFEQVASLAGSAPFGHAEALGDPRSATRPDRDRFAMRHRVAGRRSSAWPMVWPAFRIARRPVSCSSRCTTSALISTLRRSRLSRSARRGPRIGPTAAPSHAKYSASAIAVLDRLGQSAAELGRQAGSRARPDRSRQPPADETRRPGSCRSVVSTPVFPPTEASTIASREVGTWRKGMPRRNVAATNPARSPTTPPPTATMAPSRPKPEVEQRVGEPGPGLPGLGAFARREGQDRGLRSGSVDRERDGWSVMTASRRSGSVSGANSPQPAERPRLR